MDKPGVLHQPHPLVYSWWVHSPRLQAPLVSHLLCTEEGKILVDPIAFSSPSFWESLSSKGKLDAVVVLNQHHIRDAYLFAQRLNVPVFLPSGVSRESGALEYRAQQELPGGFLAIPLAQPTPTEMALVGYQILVVADALVHLEEVGGLSLLPPPFCKDQGPLKEAVKSLLVYQFDSIFFGHGTPLLEGAYQRLLDILV